MATTQAATADKAKPAAKAAKAAKAKKEAPKQELIVVSAKAMSVEVGPRVVEGWSKGLAEESKLRAQGENLGIKRHNLMGQLTEAMVKALNEDEGIDGAAIFSDDQKRINKLFEQLYVATGIKEFETITKGDSTVQKSAWAKSVHKFFPIPGKDKKDSADYQRKVNFRTNFSTTFKMCIRAAVGITARDLDAKLTSDGLLQITGPEVKKRYGVDSVVLNEKQKVVTGKDKDNNDVVTELKAKPSFTDVARIGAEASGSKLQTRTDSRATGTAPAAPVTNETAFVNLCKSIVDAANKLFNGEGLSGPQTVALKSVQSMCNTVLGATAVRPTETAKVA